MESKLTQAAKERLERNAILRKKMEDQDHGDTVKKLIGDGNHTVVAESFLITLARLQSYFEDEHFPQRVARDTNIDVEEVQALRFSVKRMMKQVRGEYE